jgi:hypothetical protein
MSLKETIIERCKADCAEQIQSCLLAVGQYRELLAQYTKRALLPGEAERLLVHLREQPLSDNSPAALESHAEIIARVQAIVDSPTIQFNAKRCADAAFLKLAAPLLKLEEAAAASLEKQLAELVEAECNFAAGYGLPHFNTPITEAVKSLLAGIRNHSFAAGTEKVTGNPILNPVSRLALGGLQVLFADESSKGEKAQE